jgi:hypothetical protein
MPDIFDLMPMTETVAIGGTSTEVHAIQLGHALQIINRFPALKEFLDGKRKEVSFGEILATGSVPAICAAGCGRFGDLPAEEHFASLDADTQAQFLGPILRLTMPRGVAPFLLSVGICADGLTGPPPPKLMTREQIAQKLVRKSSGNSSLPSSSNIEAPSASAQSGA